MDLAERLKKVLEASGLKQEQFALSVGMSVDRIKNLVAGKVQNLREAEARNIRTSHGFNELWLMHGRGPMEMSAADKKMEPALDDLRESTDLVSALDIKPEYRRVLQEILFLVKRNDSARLEQSLDALAAKGKANPDIEFIPYFSVTASAGNGLTVDSEDVVGQIAFNKAWLSRKGLKPGSLAVISAKGDSMEPTVKSGDVLLVDRNVTRISTDGIYVIERENNLFCKRLQKMIDGAVTIMSDNPKYLEQKLTSEAAESLNVAGRVVWIGGER